MIATVHVVQLNLAADPALRDPEQLLDTYHTLTGWSDAIASAGASVQVVQHFSRDATALRRGIRYTFVQENDPASPSAWTSLPRIAQAVAGLAPDVIHVNGLMFPQMSHDLRHAAPDACIVLQDHSGALPRAPLWPLTAARWRRAFSCANACTFTARPLAERWHRIGLPRDMHLIEVAEASTTLRPVGHDDARRSTGVRGSPAVLWVGRLDRNKDPMTVLAGLERVLPAVPAAHLTMIVPAQSPRREVQARIERSPALRERVTLIGPVAHTDMARYYSAADIFVSGSHHEGSGYALIESMACGMMPCVTDIPAFRALAGGCGALWSPGDPEAFARAFSSLLDRDRDTGRAAVLMRFQQALTWDAIGRDTFAAYADLLRRMRSAR
jgi:glycosyltransferase involved in cell wall biosynthesis